MENYSVNGFYDSHVHCGPEPIPRKYNVITLSKHFAKYGMKGIAKSHYFPTVTGVHTAASMGYDNVYGSIVLNHYVGGMNPDAVFAALGVEYNKKSCLKMVMMPSLHAKGHINYRMKIGSTYAVAEEWCGGVIPKGSKLLTEVEPISIFETSIKESLKDILKIIAENDLILGTGHLTKEEVKYLVPLSKEMGVNKIIITHPLYGVPGMTAEELSELTKYDGVYAEQLYALMPIDHFSIEEIAE